MIGKKVSWEELQKVLDKQADRDKTKEEVKAELKGILKGECLTYQAKEGMGSLQDFVLSTFVAEVKGLKMVSDGDLTYIYRE